MDAKVVRFTRATVWCGAPKGVPSSRGRCKWRHVSSDKTTNHNDKVPRITKQEVFHFVLVEGGLLASSLTLLV